MTNETYCLIDLCIKGAALFIALFAVEMHHWHGKNHYATAKALEKIVKQFKLVRCD